MLRGNHREALFASPADRQTLNEIVAEVVTRFGSRVHAFCWMWNHLHALIQIADRPLGDIIKRIAMRYSRYRHKVLRTTGHLFERRYKAKLIEVDAYFLVLLRYIHMNPVKAHIVTDPADYPWSSHRAYLGMDVISWLTVDFGLSLFSPDLAQARGAYRRFLSQPASDDDDVDSHCDDPRILGSDKFISKIPIAVCRPRASLSVEQLARRICLRRNVSINLLRSPSRARHLTTVRIELAREAMEQRIATLTDVARFLGRDPSALTQLLARYR
jgi:REP element-mobilizing transposase RayT